MSRSIDRARANSAVALDSDALPPGVEDNPTRLRILLAGNELFSGRGYHGTAIRDIAAVAGIQSASLYSHFASKEAILASLVFVGHDVHYGMLLTALLDAGPDPRDQLRSVVRAHVSAHCRYPKLSVTATHERQHLSQQALAPTEALRERTDQVAVEIVARGVSQRVFHVLNLRATLNALTALGLSVTSWYPEHAEGMTPDQVGDAYADLALRIVGVID
jgi:AcrR family transcriptional regulator